MHVQAKMIYLGVAEKESKKSGNQYSLVKLFDGENAEVYEFYVAGDQTAIRTKVGQLEMMKQCTAVMQLSSFQGKPQIDLVDIK